jgi:hypothetical protein
MAPGIHAGQAVTNQLKSAQIATVAFLGNPPCKWLGSFSHAQAVKKTRDPFASQEYDLCARFKTAWLLR